MDRAERVAIVDGKVFVFEPMGAEDWCIWIDSKKVGEIVWNGELHPDISSTDDDDARLLRACEQAKIEARLPKREE